MQYKSNKKEIKIQPKNIESILLDFKKDKTIPLNLKKDRFASLLANQSTKSDLEIAKYNLEYNIDIGRIFAAILVLISAFLLGWLSLWQLEPKWLALIKFVTLNSLVIFGLLTYKIIGRKLEWLHILKIALTKKDKIKNSQDEETSDIKN